MLKQSFTWWSFYAPKTDPETLLRRAAEIGYDGVEMLDEKLFPIAREIGLEITTHRAHESIEKGLNRRGHHDGIIQETEAALRLAERWNIPNLICFSGNRDGQSDDESAEITAEGLRRLAPLAQNAGVAGNPGRHELSGAQEINYPAVFQAVAESGYSGGIGHEFIPTGDAEDSLRGAYGLVLEAERRAQGFSNATEVSW